MLLSKATGKIYILAILHSLGIARMTLPWLIMLQCLSFRKIACCKTMFKTSQNNILREYSWCVRRVIFDVKCGGCAGLINNLEYLLLLSGWSFFHANTQLWLCDNFLWYDYYYRPKIISYSNCKAILYHAWVLHKKYAYTNWKSLAG